MNLPRHQHKKSLGQHFLHEPGVVERIIQSLAPTPGQRIVEIGPGAGALTLPLLKRVGALTAIEFDRDLIAPLTAAAAGIGALTLIQSDVLRVDLTALAAAGRPPRADGAEVMPAAGRLRLVGNLPYNLSSPILFHCLDHAAVIADMHFMLQKEVVDRMASPPGSRVYGRLSVMVQAVCQVTPLFTVAPEDFTPPPKVDSTVVRLTPRPLESIGIADPLLFRQTVREAFGQRRKTLRNALSRLCTAEQLRAVAIDPQARAETLAVADFVQLSNFLHDRR